MNADNNDEILDKCRNCNYGCDNYGYFCKKFELNPILAYIKCDGKYEETYKDEQRRTSKSKIV